MNKIILVDKPEGFTSFDVVAKLRGILGQKKIGHTGTLDPMATGVLVCLSGRAAKLSDIMPSDDKRYQAQITFGITTDTQDITGTVLEKKPAAVSRQALEAVLPQFVGEILQVPPMYSAIKVNGKRLYDLAREGIAVERAARKITVYSIEVLAFDAQAQTAVIDVACSKGSYIRTLAHDIGQMLGCGATLSALRRTEACGFSLESCLTLADLQAHKDNGTLEAALMPSHTAFDSLPAIHTQSWQCQMLRNGAKLDAAKLGNPKAGQHTVWCDNAFVGVIQVGENGGSIDIIYLEVTA